VAANRRRRRKPKKRRKINRSSAASETGENQPAASAYSTETGDNLAKSWYNGGGGIEAHMAKHSAAAGERRRISNSQKYGGLSWREALKKAA